MLPNVALPKTQRRHTFFGDFHFIFTKFSERWFAKCLIGHSLAIYGVLDYGVLDHGLLNMVNLTIDYTQPQKTACSSSKLRDRTLIEARMKSRIVESNDASACSHNPLADKTKKRKNDDQRILIGPDEQRILCNLTSVRFFFTLFQLLLLPWAQLFSQFHDQEVLGGLAP
jgi:hypothetical protein